VVLVEDEVGSPDVSIDDMVVGDGALILEARRILDVAPGLALQAVQGHLRVEVLAIGQHAALSAQGQQLLVNQSGLLVQELVGVGDGERHDRRLDNHAAVVDQLDVAQLDRRLLLSHLAPVHGHSQALLERAGLDEDLVCAETDGLLSDVGSRVRKARREVVLAVARRQVDEASVHLQVGVRDHVEDLVRDAVHLEVLSLEADDLRVTDDGRGIADDRERVRRRVRQRLQAVEQLHGERV